MLILQKLGLDIQLDSSCLCKNCGKGEIFFYIEITNEGKIISITTTKDSLEDVFLELTNEN